MLYEFTSTTGGYPRPRMGTPARAVHDLLPEARDIAKSTVEQLVRSEERLFWQYEQEDWSLCRQCVVSLVSHLAESLGTSRSSILEDFVSWTRILARRRGLKDAEIRAVFEKAGRVICDRLEATVHRSVIQALTLALAASEAALREGSPSMAPGPARGALAEVFGSFRDHLFAGHRNEAAQVVITAIAQGADIRAIYSHVFAPTLHEIGRRWQDNRLTAASEHFATSSIALLMDHVHPRRFSRPGAPDKVAVAACSACERHDLGLKMVADFLEMDGWNVLLLGADTPLEGLIDFMDAHHARLLLVSATMSWNIQRVSGMVDRVRESHLGQRVQVVAGGRPFIREAGLWKEIGADGFARDAAGACRVAQKLIDRSCR